MSDEVRNRLAMLRGVPGLSPAQLEALALLSEECGEVVAIIGKALRHGLTSTHPDDRNGDDNRLMISREAGQVVAAIYIAIEIGALELDTFDAGAREKWFKVGKYLHHIVVDPLNRSATERP